jgi:hypothetical protein
MVVQMNDDTRKLTEDETNEVNNLIARIEMALSILNSSDAIAIIALTETLARVTIMHSAGQQVYEGKNGFEALATNIRAVHKASLEAMERASYKFNETVKTLTAIKAEEGNRVVH